MVNKNDQNIGNSSELRLRSSVRPGVCQQYYYHNFGPTKLSRIWSTLLTTNCWHYKYALTFWADQRKQNMRMRKK